MAAAERNLKRVTIPLNMSRWPDSACAGAKATAAEAGPSLTPNQFPVAQGPVPGGPETAEQSPLERCEAARHRPWFCLNPIISAVAKRASVPGPLPQFDRFPRSPFVPCNLPLSGGRVDLRCSQQRSHLACAVDEKNNAFQLDGVFAKAMQGHRRKPRASYSQ